jgi:hypothetical protein
MGSVSTYIHYQTAVIVTMSGDVNRHSSIFKMATVMKEWTNEEVRPVIRFSSSTSTYSPDMAPLDFHLFPKMKKHLKG